MRFSLFYLSFFLSTISSQAQNKFDSLFHILQIHASSSKELIIRMDSLREAEAAEPFMLDLLQSSLHSELAQYRMAEVYGKRAFDSDSVQQNSVYYVKLANILAHAYYVNNRYDEAAKYAHKVLQIESRIDPARVAQITTEARFLLGRIYFRMGDRKAALDCFDLCRNSLSQSRVARDLAGLSYYLGEITTLYIDINQYDEALELCLERETIIHRIDSLGGAPKGYTDQQRAYLYSKMAFVYQLMNRQQEAEFCYRQFGQTASSKKSFEGSFIIPYLIESRKFSIALESEQKTLNAFDGDTVSFQYLTSISRIAKCMAGLNRHSQAIEYLHRELILTDSINARQRRSEALEMNLLYDTEKKEAEIARQQKRIVVLMSISIGLIVLLVIIFVVGFVIWRQRKINREKNLIIYRQIKEQEQLQSKLQQEKKGEELFDRLSRLMATQQPYIDSDLNRDELAAMLATNTNYLSQAIKEHAGIEMTIHSYINAQRLNHACRLIASSPHSPSFEEIAIASGFGSLRTFLRHFKSAYSITPIEYYRLGKHSPDKIL